MGRCGNPRLPIGGTDRDLPPRPWNTRRSQRRDPFRRARWSGPKLSHRGLRRRRRRRHDRHPRRKRVTCARRRLSETRWETITKQQTTQAGGAIETARRAAIEVEVGAIRTFDLSRHSIRRLKFLCTKFGHHRDRGDRAPVSGSRGALTPQFSRGMSISTRSLVPSASKVTINPSLQKNAVRTGPE